MGRRSTLVLAALLASGCHRVFGVDPGDPPTPDAPDAPDAASVVSIASLDAPPTAPLLGLVSVTANLVGPKDMETAYAFTTTAGMIIGAKDGSIVLDGNGDASLAVMYRGTALGPAIFSLEAGGDRESRTIDVVDPANLVTIGRDAPLTTVVQLTEDTLYGMEMPVTTACSLESVGFRMDATVPGRLAIALYRDDQSTFTLIADFGIHQPMAGGRVEIPVDPIALTPASYYLVILLEEPIRFEGNPGPDTYDHVQLGRPFGAGFPSPSFNAAPTQSPQLSFFLKVTEDP